MPSLTFLDVSGVESGLEHPFSQMSSIEIGGSIGAGIYRYDPGTNTEADAPLVCEKSDLEEIENAEDCKQEAIRLGKESGRQGEGEIIMFLC